MGNMGWLESSAWICDFSSTYSTMARSSGHVGTDDVANLGEEVGSVESLEVSPTDAAAGRRRAISVVRSRLTAAGPWHAARTPVGGVGRLRLKGADNHRFDP